MEVHEDAHVGGRDDHEGNADAAEDEEEGVVVLVAAVKEALETTGELVSVYPYAEESVG